MIQPALEFGEGILHPFPVDPCFTCCLFSVRTTTVPSDSQQTNAWDLDDRDGHSDLLSCAP